VAVAVAGDGNGNGARQRLPVEQPEPARNSRRAEDAPEQPRVASPNDVWCHAPMGPAPTATAPAVAPADTPGHLDADTIYAQRQRGELSETRPIFDIVDLFCGAGGMTLGFCAGRALTRPTTERRGHHFNFRSVWANDYNTHAAQTYNANFGADHCVAGPIQDVLQQVELPRADVVIGGPPCQGFSLLNRHRSGDGRRAMWQHYMEVVERTRASVFVMENVPQLLKSDEFGHICKRADAMGFDTSAQILLAADYGVPQTRKRAIVLGWRRDRHPVGPRFAPTPTHFHPDKRDRYPSLLDGGQPWLTVRDAIAALPPGPVGTQIRAVPAPLDLHFGRTPTELSKRRYRLVPNEGDNRETLFNAAPELTPRCWHNKKGGTDLFGRLWWDRPSVTVRTEFFKPEKGRYLHPSEHRPITHREAARFQSFHDWFAFEGSKTQIARQIGNAVPAVMAARIADSVLELLLSRS
ncbi:MAG: DNA (cytosine-5)-methyltransferase 1, partial [Myxococcota bacterium]